MSGPRSDLPPLTPEEAARLTSSGGTVVATGLPEGAEFGIGMRSYTIGPNFRGVKMIPPGIHFVTHGMGIEKVGLFLRFGPGDVHVFEFDPRTELLKASSAEDAARCGEAVRRGELDASLGPYPLSTHPEWEGLSKHIDECVLRRAGLPFGALVLPGGIDEEEEALVGKEAGLVQPYFDDLPRTATWVQTDLRKRWRTDARLGGAGLQGAQLTRFFQDRSQWLEHLLSAEYGGGAGAEAALLGELQLGFLLFLLLSSLGALTQWKALLSTVCGSDDALRCRPTLFALLLPALTAQLRLAPEDFFVDALSGDNFLRGAAAPSALPPRRRRLPTRLWPRPALGRACRRVATPPPAAACRAAGGPRAARAAPRPRAGVLAALGDAADAAGARLDAPLAAELARFWGFVRTRFDVDVLQLRRERHEEDEDAPVLVLGTEEEAEALGAMA